MKRNAVVLVCTLLNVAVFVFFLFMFSEMRHMYEKTLLVETYLYSEENSSERALHLDGVIYSKEQMLNNIRTANLLYEEFLEGEVGEYQNAFKTFKTFLRKKRLTYRAVGETEASVNQMKKQLAFEEITIWISGLKNHNGDYKYIKYIDDALKFAGLRYEDISTTRGELEALAFNNAKKAVYDCLHNLKSGSSFYMHYIEKIRDYLHKYNISLEDFGSSESELESLKKRNATLAAKQSLIRLKKHYTASEHEDLLEHLHHAEQTLQDIGSSEAEILALQQ